MGNLAETVQYEEGIYQIETTDPVLGGADGISNRQGRQLANRTAWLKQEVERNATTATAGRMSAGDKLKLDGVAEGAAALGSTAGVAPALTGAAGSAETAARSDHRHPLPELATTAVNGLMSADDKLKLTALLVSTVAVYTSGSALPATNIGPIWHEDYASIMTWQVFNANGAAYEGYASVLVGSLLLDTQPTPRTGFIRSGVANLSRTVYAALRGWAIHHGRVVDPGVWVAGEICCADNPDGTTFQVYDVRGEFLRAWDDGRGLDNGRVFGSHQKGTLVAWDDYSGVWGVSNDTTTSSPETSRAQIGADAFNPGDYSPLALEGIESSAAVVLPGETSGGWSGITRPVNTALLACIKY